jgi:hypothetical protein
MIHVAARHKHSFSVDIDGLAAHRTSRWLHLRASFLAVFLFNFNEGQP